MSSITHGMNPEEVEALGRQLQTAANQLNAVITELERAVGSASWLGPDATTFKTQWWPEHRAHLKTVADGLHGFGQSALNNASEQRNVSGH